MDPYVPSTRRVRRSRQRRIIVYGISVGVAFLTLLTFVVVRQAPFLRIEQVIFKGLDEQSDVVRAAFEHDFTTQRLLLWQARWFGSMSYFAWPDALSFSSPLVAGVTIEKNFLDRSVTITAIPRKPLGVWCAGEGGEMSCWWFDSVDGVILGEAALPDGNLVPRINEPTALPLAPGDALISQPSFSHLRTIIDLFGAFPRTMHGLTLNRRSLEVEGVVEGATVRFSLRFSPQAALAGLAELLRREPEGSLKKIDLTVERKMFVTRN